MRSNSCNKFVENEGMIHKSAKQKLASWLIQKDQANTHVKTLAQFQWRRNYGVFMELKFHEKDDPYYFELSKGLRPYNGYSPVSFEDWRGKNPVDWFDPTFDRGRILFVPDIVIFHKGVPNIFIEIVHTNPVSENKIKSIRKFFSGHFIHLYEIKATHILQHRIPPLLFDCIREFKF